MSKRSLVAALACALMLVPMLASATSASAVHGRIHYLDDCDSATFRRRPANPNACVKQDETTFDEFIGQLVSIGPAPAWRFAPGTLSLPVGGSIDAYSRGGEFHTFTEVAAFGGGCVQQLNQVLGLSLFQSAPTPGSCSLRPGSPRVESWRAPRSQQGPIGSSA